MRPEYIRQYEGLERGHWWWRARRRIVVGALRGLPVPAGAPPSLLDVGCGAGLTLAALRADFRCAGLEPDPELAAAARRNAGVPVEQGALCVPHPFLGRRFDRVLLLDVIEHIDDDVAALRAAGDLLAEGGRLIINVPAMPSLWSVHDVVNEHKRRYTAAALARTLVGAGLSADWMRYWGICLAPIAWAARRLTGERLDPSRYRVSMPPWPVGACLERLVGLEYAALGRGAPFGLSLLAAAGRRA